MDNSKEKEKAIKHIDDKCKEFMETLEDVVNKIKAFKQENNLDDKYEKMNKEK